MINKFKKPINRYRSPIIRVILKSPSFVVVLYFLIGSPIIRVILKLDFLPKYFTSFPSSPIIRVILKCGNIMQILKSWRFTDNKSYIEID